MQLVKPSIEHVGVTTDPLKSIERAGRVCYKSEDKITEGSAEKFVEMLLKRGHHAMIEHGNFILSVPVAIYEEIRDIEDRQYLRMSYGKHHLISGNPRALMDLCIRPDVRVSLQKAFATELVKVAPVIFQPMLDNHLGDTTDCFVRCTKLYTDIDALTTREKLKHQVASYRIVCNRGFTHELVRHRPPSFAQKSTRYCNYKGGVSFIIPPWLNLPEGEYRTCRGTMRVSCNGQEISPASDIVSWLEALCTSEHIYKELTDAEWAAQKARGVLPIDLKTEIVITCNLQEWRTIFGLRCTPARAPKEDLVNGIWYHATAPHPQMQEIANMILVDMKNRVPVIFDDMGV